MFLAGSNCSVAKSDEFVGMSESKNLFPGPELSATYERIDKVTPGMHNWMQGVRCGLTSSKLSECLYAPLCKQVS